MASILLLWNRFTSYFSNTDEPEIFDQPVTDDELVISDGPVSNDVEP